MIFEKKYGLGIVEIRLLANSLVSFFVGACFFSSGFLALAYQVLWSKYIHNFVGVSSYSYAIVLSSFMGGMALGSWLLGRLMNSKRNPLKVYAALEILIGIYAIVLFNPLLEQLFQWYGTFNYNGSLGNSFSGIGLKLFCCSSLLLIPSMLMGATFPAMVSITRQFQPSIGASVALCYGINSAGAVLGSIFMAFFLLPWFGMQANLMLCGIISSLIGLVSFVLSKRFFSADLSTTNCKKPTFNLFKVLLLILIFLEGILGFSLEIVWTRYFALVFGSSTYSFATMLSALISGITIGSLVLYSLDNRVKNPVNLFGWTQILMGLSLLLSLALYPYLPVLFKFLNSQMIPSSFTYAIYELLKFFIAFGLMLIPTFFGGMSLPLIVKSFIREEDKLAQESGVVYAADTMGNVIGALLAAMLLMPLLGLQNMFLFISLACIFVGISAMFIAFRYEATKVNRSVMFILPLVLVISIQIASQAWKLEHLAVVPHRRTPGKTWSQSLERAEKIDVLFSKDDPATSIMVVKHNDQSIALLNNGKPDASDKGDMKTQLLLGHIPAVLKPDISDVCLVGLGSGVTAGAILKHDIKNLHVIELTQAVVDAQKFFTHVNFKALDDSRLRLTVDDARSVLSFDKVKYDVVISEPSNPWQAGVANLFTSDFYELVKRRLKPDGLFVQWLQLYETNNTLFTSSILTLRSVFPYLYGFRSQHGDLLVVATNEPIQLDGNNINDVFEDEKLMIHFNQHLWSEPQEFFAVQTQTPQSMDALASLGLNIYNNDNLLLEHSAPKALFLKRPLKILKRFDDRYYQSSELLYNKLSNKHYTPNSFESFSQKDTALKSFTRANYLAYFYKKTHIDKKPVDITNLEPLFSVYKYEELKKFLIATAEKQKWVQFSKIWSIYKDGLILFLIHNDKLVDVWSNLTRTWLIANPPSKIQRELVRFALNLKAHSKNYESPIDLFNDYIEAEDPVFSTEAISKLCQIVEPQHCIRYKQKLLTNNPDHPVGNLRGFPKNKWSLPH